MKYNDEIYYSNEASTDKDDYGLGNIAKINIIDNAKKILASEISTLVYVENNKVFAKDNNYKLHVIDLNSDNNDTILSNVMGFIYVVNNDIYYANSLSFSKYNLDTQKEEIVLNNGVYSIYIDNNKVYYSLSENNSEIYMMNLDGTNNIKLFSQDNLSISDIVVRNNIIYFISNEVLYQVNIDGTNLKVLNNKTINKVSLTDNYIYYLSGFNYNLYRMDLNGENETLILEKTLLNYEIIDDKIYFNDTENTKTQMCDNNGKNIKSISIH